MDECLKRTVIEALGLQPASDSSTDLYVLAKRRYLLFYPDEVTKANTPQVLENITKMFSPEKKKEWKTVIVVANTPDSFKNDGLLWFDSVNTGVVFYLINPFQRCAYWDKSWIISSIGLGYKKFLKQIRAIIEPMLTDEK